MWTALVPCGIAWLDAELGGFPARGVIAVQSRSGGGKTAFALANTLAALSRGPACLVTSEAPETVLETAQSVFEVDLRPAIRNGMFSVLSFAPFFVNKVRSMNSVEAPMLELGEYLKERRATHVVLDTLDPALSWMEPATAKLGVRALMELLRSWQTSVLCTVGTTSPVATEFVRTASGSIELIDDRAVDAAAGQPANRLIVRHAGWCNVYGTEGTLQLVQGRGFVASRAALRTASATTGSPATSTNSPRGKQSDAFTLIGDPRAAPSGPPGRPVPAHEPRQDATLFLSNRNAPPVHPESEAPQTSRMRTLPIEDSAPTIVRIHEDLSDETVMPTRHRKPPK